MGQLFLSLVILTIIIPSYAGVYKWTDANGKVHYSDKPLEKDKAQAVNISKPAPVNPESKIKLQNLKNQMEGSRQLREEKEAAEQQAAVSRQDKCQKKREHLSEIEESGTVYKMDGDQRVYLDYKEKDEYVARIKRELKENCE